MGQKSLVFIVFSYMVGTVTKGIASNAICSFIWLAFISVIWQWLNSGKQLANRNLFYICKSQSRWLVVVNIISSLDHLKQDVILSRRKLRNRSEIKGWNSSVYFTTEVQQMWKAITPKCVSDWWWWWIHKIHAEKVIVSIVWILPKNTEIQLLICTNGWSTWSTRQPV